VDLARLQAHTKTDFHKLKQEVSSQSTQTAQSALQKEHAELLASLQSLEHQIIPLSHTVATIGSHLQKADLQLHRANDAIEQISRLQEFAHARDFSDLSPLFQDPKQIKEAAMVVGKLLHAIKDLPATTSSSSAITMSGSMSSRSHRVSPSLSPTKRYSENASSTPTRHNHHHGFGHTSSSSHNYHHHHPRIGSLENALEELQLYRSLLDNQLVAKFDEAMALEDFDAMSQCVRAMAYLEGGEAMLIRRYIATRPMFTDPKEVRMLEYATKSNAFVIGSSSSNKNEGSSGGVAGGGEVAGGGGEDYEGAVVTAMRLLSSMYKAIIDSVRKEAIVIEQVFPSPSTAMIELINRIFEQAVQTGLDTLLRPPSSSSSSSGGGVSPLALRAYLELLAQAYNKTVGLAKELLALAGCSDNRRSGAGLQNTRNNNGGDDDDNNNSEENNTQYPTSSRLADEACGTALERYPDLERSWLSYLSKDRLGTFQHNIDPHQNEQHSLVSQDLIRDVAGAYEEAVKRCTTLFSSDPVLAAKLVASFFYNDGRSSSSGSTDGGNNNNYNYNTNNNNREGICLLEAATQHMMHGLHTSVENCRSTLHHFSINISKSSAFGSTVTKGLVEESIEWVLQAIIGCRGAMKEVKEHYVRVIQPLVIWLPSPSPSLNGGGGGVRGPDGASSVASPSLSLECTQCEAGLNAVTATVEAVCANALQQALVAVTSALDALLIATQKPTDFNCPAHGQQHEMMMIDKPTSACLAAISLLSAVTTHLIPKTSSSTKSGENGLHGVNLTSFMMELARGVHISLHAHMLRSGPFSQKGALRWKRDLAEYTACIASAMARAGAGGGRMQSHSGNNTTTTITAAAASSRVATVEAQFEELSALTGLLVIAPEGLTGLIDAVLKMSHKRARQYLILREDWGTARVGGKTLGELFKGE
jgi:hypothetical protein